MVEEDVTDEAGRILNLRHLCSIPLGASFSRSLKRTRSGIESTTVVYKKRPLSAALGMMDWR